MTTFYREINVGQEPFDGGQDAAGRATCKFNIRVIKSASATFTEDIAGKLVTAGVGILGSGIFIGAKADIPTGDGPYLTITETGGMAPERTHNSITVPAYQRPSAQIAVRAKDYVTARTMARAAYNALVGVRNSSI